MFVVVLDLVAVDTPCVVWMIGWLGLALLLETRFLGLVLLVPLFLTAKTPPRFHEASVVCLVVPAVVEILLSLPIVASPIPSVVLKLLLSSVVVITL